MRSWGSPRRPVEPWTRTPEYPTSRRSGRTPRTGRDEAPTTRPSVAPESSPRRGTGGLPGGRRREGELHAAIGRAAERRRARLQGLVRPQPLRLQSLRRHALPLQVGDHRFRSRLRQRAPGRRVVPGVGVSLHDDALQLRVREQHPGHVVQKRVGAGVELRRLALEGEALQQLQLVALEADALLVLGRAALVRPRAGRRGAVVPVVRLAVAVPVPLGTPAQGGDALVSRTGVVLVRNAVAVLVLLRAALSLHGAGLLGTHVRVTFHAVAVRVDDGAALALQRASLSGTGVLAVLHAIVVEVPSGTALPEGGARVARTLVHRVVQAVAVGVLDGAAARGDGPVHERARVLGIGHTVAVAVGSGPRLG